MISSSQLPWMKIHDFLLNIENVLEPKEFCVQVIKKIYLLIPYDQARIYFVNDNGKIDDEVLIGVEQRWSDVYLEYYSKIENGRYSIPKLKGSVYDWTNYEYNEFISDYIKPQGLNYSLGFGLHRADTFRKSVFSLDRTSRSGYTPQEIGIMSIIQPHLDNLHKNLFVFPLINSYYNKNPEVQMPFTKREWEIADLLCKGMTPINISSKLFISLSTVYRHIANIHTKLNVSNRQELLLKLINYSRDHNKL